MAGLVDMMNWFKSLIAKQMLKNVRKEIEMTGWKTKAGGIGAILGGAALIITGVIGDKFDFELVKQGVAGIVGGLGLLGIGHKLDKNNAAVSKSTHLE
jgi:hypothetical protein